MATTESATTQLAELAELGMDVARRLHATLMTAQGRDLIAFTDAYCDVTRGIRQSIALRLRIESGSFAQPLRARAEADPDAEPDEAPERPERGDRADWNEYERPDWETPLRLTGDPDHDAEAIEAAVASAVVKIRKRYAKAEAVLGAERRPTTRAALLTGAAPLRPVDSS